MDHNLDKWHPPPHRHKWNNAFIFLAKFTFWFAIDFAELVLRYQAVAGDAATCREIRRNNAFQSFNSKLLIIKYTGPEKRIVIYGPGVILSYLLQLCGQRNRKSKIVLAITVQIKKSRNIKFVLKFFLVSTAPSRNPLNLDPPPLPFEQ